VNNQQIKQFAAVRTQSEVAEILGIDHSRVYQIEKQALAKLRRALEKRGFDSFSGAKDGAA